MRHLILTLTFALSISPLGAQPGGLGLNFDLPSYRGTPYKMKLASTSYQNLPAKASLEAYAPTPGDQGNYSTCTAFATAYHLRTILLAKQLNETNKKKIDQLVLSPSFVYEQIKDAGDDTCAGGSNPVMALELLKTVGVATNQTMPYQCAAPLNRDALLEAPNFTISDYQILFLPDDADVSFRINATKKSLAEGYPVLLAMIVPESFYQPGKIWMPTASDSGPSGDHGRHAMCIVGYDDTIGGGAFRVLNSWGPDWCDGGYVWIRYQDYATWALGALQAYPQAAAPAPTPTPSPTPTPAPAPAPASNFSGAIRFEQNTGQIMPLSRVSTRNLFVEEETAGTEALVAYRMNSAYPSGTRFRFYLTANNESYIYAFATDQTQKINKILPYDDGMSPHIGPNSTVAFPSDTKVIRMDNQPGTDYLLILFSKEPLNVAQIQRTMETTAGSLTAKIRAALGNKLTDTALVDYQAGGASFVLPPTTAGSVVPLMVEIEHQ